MTMRMKQKLLSLLILTGLFASSLPAHAANETVTIDPFVLSRCGQQGIPFSGTVTGSGYLELNLDSSSSPNTLVFAQAVNNTNWITGFIPVGTGHHTVYANLFSFKPPEPDSFGNSPNLLAQASYAFEVVACPTPAPAPSSDNGGSSSGGGGGGGGSEEPQSQPKPVKKVGQVKGITTVKGVATIVNKNVPSVIDRLFRQVFVRKITPQESTYWKKRARTDKRTEVSLMGTMQWYKAHGTTKGK